MGKKNEVEVVKENHKTEIVFDLENGKKCKVIQGKGTHAVMAQRNINPENKEESYRIALQAAMTFIDDKPILPEHLLALSFKDYHAVLAAWSELNF